MIHTDMENQRMNDEERSDGEQDFDTLCTQALENAKEDRATLKEHLTKLKDFIKSAGPGGSEVVLATDAVVKTTDTMVKLNAQVISIAQLKLKKLENEASFAPNEDEFDDDDVQDAYDEIEGRDVTEDKPN